jgi:hypothetical protein
MKLEPMPMRPLALPAPAWHTHNTDRPQIFAMMRGASSKEVFALLDDHQQFMGTLEREKGVWNGQEFLGWRKTWGATRNMDYAQSNEIDSGAQSVLFFIQSNLLDRFREELGKKEIAAARAAGRRKAKRNNARMDRFGRDFESLGRRAA